MLKFKFDFFPSKFAGVLASCNVHITTSDKHTIKLNGAMIRESKTGNKPWLALPNFPVTRKDGDKVYIPYLNFEEEDKTNLLEQAVEAYIDWSREKGGSRPANKPRPKPREVDFDDDDTPF